MRVKDILDRTKRQPVTIAPDKTVLEAMQKISDNKIGSLIVIDDKGAPVGIITERDIFRLALKHRGNMVEMTVGDKMTTDVVIGLPDDDIDYIARVITSNRIRHIPIIDKNNTLLGLVSIGDIVKARLDDAEVHVRYLTEYITGRSTIS